MRDRTGATRADHEGASPKRQRSKRPLSTDQGKNSDELGMVSRDFQTATALPDPFGGGTTGDGLFAFYALYETSKTGSTFFKDIFKTQLFKKDNKNAIDEEIKQANRQLLQLGKEKIGDAKER
ncbi:MAG: hypothetical protein IH948_03805 [Bacteroidetes bacterium]|nr:hypothetical protein [Bacteroidota bacterium]